VWLIAVAAVVSLPVSAAVTYYASGKAAVNGDGTMLFRIYPQLLLLPPIVFPIAFWAIASAFSILPMTLRRRFVCFTAVGLLLTVVVTAWTQLSASPVLLLELKSTASCPQSEAYFCTEEGKVLREPGRLGTISWPALYKAYFEYLSDIQNIRGLSPTEYDVGPAHWSEHGLAPQAKKRLGDNWDTLRRGLCDYRTWQGRRQYSWTRLFYTLEFGFSLFGVIVLFAGGGSCLPDIPNQVRRKYLYFLALATFCFGIWIPARIYFNVAIDGPVFGSAYRVPPLDIFLLLMFVIFGIILALCEVLPADRIRQIVSLVAMIIPAGVGWYQVEVLDRLFGFHSRPVNWILLAAFIGLCVAVFHFWSEGKQKPVNRS
jgi:hypothetical protein